MQRCVAANRSLFFSGAAAVCLAAAGSADQVRLPAGLPDNPRLRVAVVRASREVPVTFERGYVAVTPQREITLRKLAKPVSGPLRTEDEGLSLAGALFRIYGVRFYPPDRRFLLGDRRYAGVLEVLRAKDGSLTLVEEVGVEEYIEGVLPRELPASWPAEVLKAQAVLSRSFALYKSLTRGAHDYDVVVEGWAQRYGGESSEHAKSNKAVADTRGEVLVYRRNLLLPFFHANCGGRTTRPETIWDIAPHPSLREVASEWSLRERHGTWSLELSPDAVFRALLKAGFRVGPIARVTIAGRDASGRALRFHVRHLDGELDVPANAFRLALGADRMKSTLVTIERRAGKILFAGHGWGHGVGLCQWGAKAMAERGKTYREILDHYFPGTAVARIAR